MDRQRALESAHPESVVHAPDGRLVELKAHQGAWSGAHPENSLAALRECYAAAVARVEIDFRLRDGEFVVAHDKPRKGRRVPPLREALDIVRGARPGPTLLMLDAKDDAPWSSHHVESLVRMCESVRDRIFVGSPADWNLRRLRKVDPALAIAFDPQYYLTWDSRVHAVPGRRGAYGYQDVHPLALRRTVSAADYLRERFETLLGVVDGIREVHLRLAFFERMLRDGFDVAAFAHDANVLVDVWTLDAGTPAWKSRLARAVAEGADIVTTNTPRQFAEARQPSEASP
ncbi:MAG: glycerophosphodiester phosphodiesterase [Candidatus Limnocylindria bacterium]